MTVEQARALRAKIDQAATPADPVEARAVRQALAKLTTDAAAARALAEQFRTATTTQKNSLMQQRFDDVLDSLADTYDLLAKVIKAVVRDQQ